MSIAARDRLIVALDVPTLAEAEALVVRLGEAISHVKVGLELFVAEGPRAVEVLVARGLKVMLDLKLCDIPETVARATAQAAALGAGLLTIHTSGGREMMRAARQAAQDRVRLLGVTVLTSLGDQDLVETGAGTTVGQTVAARAKLARAAGLEGLVCSPLEAAGLRAALGPDVLLVTPGVRPAGAAVGDQKRVATPQRARQDGADYVVVGRPIRDAADPAGVARAIVKELA